MEGVTSLPPLDSIRSSSPTPSFGLYPASLSHNVPQTSTMDRSSLPILAMSDEETPVLHSLELMGTPISMPCVALNWTNPRSELAELLSPRWSLLVSPILNPWHLLPTSFCVGLLNLNSPFGVECNLVMLDDHSRLVELGPGIASAKQEDWDVPLRVHSLFYPSLNWPKVLP